MVRNAGYRRVLYTGRPSTPNPELKSGPEGRLGLAKTWEREIRATVSKQSSRLPGAVAPGRLGPSGCIQVVAQGGFRCD